MFPSHVPVVVPRKQCHIKAFKLRQLSSVPKKYGSREMQDSAAIYKPGFLHPGQERTRSTIVIGQTAAGQAFEPGWSFFFLGT